jgi:hypothetical protein
MESEKYSIRVSPEVLTSDIFKETYSGDTGVNTFGVFTGMSYVLSGGTNGDSLLTGLTIPVMFTQTYNDLGYYSEFDGFLLQKDILLNFLYSGTNEFNPYEVTIYNTSGDFSTSYLDFTTFNVSWGDGNTNQLTTKSLTHNYLAQGTYTLSMSGSNPWGVTTIQKTIDVPFTGVTIDNPNGTITFTPQQGSWSGIPVSYDYIYDYDSDNTISGQVSSNFTTIPFNISGYTKSRLQELRRYGSIPFSVGYIFTKGNQTFGQIDEITDEYTAYTINNISYFDLLNGKTFYVVSSSGITSNDIVASAITKNEALINVIDQPEVQTDIYVERGKNSALERVERLGEVDNVGDLQKYGYGFFNVEKQ